MWGGGFVWYLGFHGLIWYSFVGWDLVGSGFVVRLLVVGLVVVVFVVGGCVVFGVYDSFDLWVGC